MGNQSTDQTVATQFRGINLGNQQADQSMVTQSTVTTMMVTQSPMATLCTHSADQTAAIKASPAQPAAAACLTTSDLHGTTCREASNPVNPPAAAGCWQSKPQVTQVVRSVDCRSKMTLANQDWADLGINTSRQGTSRMLLLISLIIAAIVQSLFHNKKYVGHLHLAQLADLNPSHNTGDKVGHQHRDIAKEMLDNKDLLIQSLMIKTHHQLLKKRKSRWLDQLES